MSEYFDFAGRSVQIPKDWAVFFENEIKKEYFADLSSFLKNEFSSNVVFPLFENIFRAFSFNKPDLISVVVLGQDPYHGQGQADGLAFSVGDGVAIPPSLKNIYKEIKQSTGCRIVETGNLEKWAKQGVFLLNAVLTVQKDCAASHQNKGWEIFTDSVIAFLSNNNKNTVFVLWGNYARKKKNIIDSEKHLILESAHPSPLSASRGFFGNGHFVKINDYLTSKGRNNIEW